VRRATSRLIASIVSFVLVVPSLHLQAQERPIVFVHGVGSSPDTWQGTAARLQAGLEITPGLATVTWRNSLESQGDEVQRQFGGFPGSTIAIGHSLGGIVSRQWSRQHPLSGVITVGSPNRGAPIANNLNDWAGFNTALFSSVGNAFYWLGNISYDRWWWVYAVVEGSLSWGGYVSNFSLRHVVTELGMQFGFPFIQEIYVGSPYLDNLNGWNLAREASEIPSRVGIVNTATEYWRGGPFRLKDPNYGGEYSYITGAAAAALDYWAISILAEADPFDTNAQNLAFSLLDVSFWLWNFDEFWCRATSDDRPLWYARCQPNDLFVPTWSQYYPGGTVNLEINGGPVHTQETSQFGDFLYVALTNFMNVPPRGGTPPGPPNPEPPPSSSGPGGPRTMSPDQSLYPGASVSSPDGRFRLTYQWDGNLVLYRWDDLPLWHTHTDGTSPGRAVMQLDGNLVVYDGSGTPRWASGTAGYDNAYLAVQDDGNVVVYTAGGAALWASWTNGY
jgi:pimeloyl-ACP methyl ester carboxylesterase